MITATEFERSARIIGCETAVIRAVAKVESNGAGFDAQGKLKILFEPHVFWKQLQAQGIDPDRHKTAYADVLYKEYRQEHGPYNIQWQKLNRAKQLQETAALQSASYGMFQIMGFNFKAAGFTNVYAMINAFTISEDEQLKGFINFIVANKLSADLREKDFTAFARKYNGPAYAKNAYDVKIRQYYQQFAQEVTKR
ncbi:N-acetylmuramidase family protein [Chitinophaga sp. 22321]|uniref:N-acetylmuramidase family protein n=1 Tax=Chitinophaga hostae TaxID=2831022 RepID=A0ABS5J944_9BACT|nr:N-acetylmuramidase family protein [Chitinophaga hostae]MBS0031600.1 N-acetylmuramidase family protein [Chitinophaga hostae]